MFEVLSTSGDTHLGGDDFDKRIVDFLAEDFRKSEGIDLRKDRQALQVRRRQGVAGRAGVEQRGRWVRSGVGPPPPPTRSRWLVE